MPWIDAIPYDQAEGPLKTIYDRVKGPGNKVDNILAMHSLRPHTLEGHMMLYKNVLHNSNNTVPKWFLETVGVWVSALNQCSYCVDHHFAGLRRLLKDDARSDEILAAITDRAIDRAPLDDAQKEALRYAEILTVAPKNLVQADVQKLRELGYSDGEILEINQVAAYFNYANRTVLGLGCSTDGETLGLSPNDSSKPDDWNHG
ncbi:MULTISPECIES: carboxymuconolactone decarboxylase family protein [Hoeflea]|uniref:Peroxidase-related enzyme n=1 Tax=Hoeflea algicola TaxID=2983763 RepID=A0ABT3ZF90_9HYPH|nr:peroxidase-related enzyme [Hoeflea algicola]MCY0150368.1 peroxidase-related enzyme [Hoeflea algicola]